MKVKRLAVVALALAAAGPVKRSWPRRQGRRVSAQDLVDPAAAVRRQSSPGRLQQGRLVIGWGAPVRLSLAGGQADLYWGALW